MEKVTVSADALRQILQALNGPGHYIRELQALRNGPFSGDNPINKVADEYNAALQRPEDGQAQEMFRHCLPADSMAAQDVLTERRGQIEAEGWTPEHDDENTGFELARAGACYAEYGTWPAHSEIPPNSWPWPDAKWKPRGYRRNLIKACALLLAEIERIDRAEAAKLQPSKSASMLSQPPTESP